MMIFMWFSILTRFWERETIIQQHYLKIIPQHRRGTSIRAVRQLNLHCLSRYLQPSTILTCSPPYSPNLAPCDFSPIKMWKKKQYESWRNLHKTSSTVFNNRIYKFQTKCLDILLPYFACLKLLPFFRIEASSCFFMSRKKIWAI